MYNLPAITVVTKASACVNDYYKKIMITETFPDILIIIKDYLEIMGEDIKKLNG